MDIAIWKDRDNQSQTEYSAVKTRQENDMKLYRLEAQSLKDKAGREIPDLINETSSIPMTFADNLVSDIAESNIQLSIESKSLTDKQQAAVVSWLNVMLEAIDEYLSLRGDPGLFYSLIWQAAMRGRNLTLVYPYLAKGLIVPHVIPWDVWSAQYKALGIDKGWGIYKMTRSKSLVEMEYPDISLAGKTGADINIWDCWDEKYHDVVMEGALAKSDEHKLGMCPLVYEVVHNSPYVRDTGFREYEGESIFSAIRQAIPSLNRYKTIAASLSMRSLLNGLQFPNVEGKQAQIDGDPTGNRTITPMGVNDRFLPMPIEDLRQSTQLGLQTTQAEIRMGTLPILELGEIKGDNTLPQITQANDVTRKKQSPLIKALERSMRRICRMIVTIAQRQEWTDVREFVPGIELELPEAKLMEEFRIKCQITPTAPLENIARVQLAVMLERFLSQYSILSDTLKLENPDEELLRKNEERVEAQSPRLAIWKAAKRNLESKDADQREDGAILALELGLSPEQISKGEVPEASPSSAIGTEAGGAESIGSQQKAMATRLANTAAKTKGG